MDKLKKSLKRKITMTVAVYTRQSVDKKDSISIESQIDFCKKELTGQEEYKPYIDRGFSGKNTNRPAFESMINDIKLGLVKRVIVYKLDRISRSTLDFANIIEIFKKHNVEFTSSTEKFDTSTPIGKAMLSIIMVFAELERETIQKRITDNYYARGKKGFFLGGVSPYGFDKIKTSINGIKTSTFIGNSDQLPHLIKMYEMYANTNMSLGKISDYLNENNIPSASKGLWDSGKISRIMRSPLYVKADSDIYTYYKNRGCIINNDISDFVGINGCYLYGKRESNERKYTNVENHVLSIGLHEGIINSNMWLKCQYKLDSNKQIKNTGKGKYSWLSGLVKCGYCGYAVSVIKSGHSDKKYFNCRGKTNLKICKGHSKPIFVDDIEKIVKSYILDRVSHLKNVKLIVKDEDNPNVNRIKLQLSELDNQIKNLINQMSVSNNVVIEYINEKVNSLDKTKKMLLDEIKKAPVNINIKPSIGDILKKVDDWEELSLEEKKSICTLFIDKVFIKDDEIHINSYS